MPDVIPASETHLLRFLYAVRHVERRPATDTKRGRPSSWPREKLVEAAAQLRSILERETLGRVSLNSFTRQYLPLLLYPSDITDALASGQVNLQEAAQLARLTSRRLDCAPPEAGRRAEVLRQHLAVQGSQTRLRACVKELLGDSERSEISSEAMAGVVTKVDEMLEVAPSDARYMFWEEMKRLFYAMKESSPKTSKGAMDDFLAAMDGVSNVLFRVERRRQERHKREASGRQAI
jgi:hypothetical protein